MEKKNNHLSILITCLIFIGLVALFAVVAKNGFRELRQAEERRDQLARFVEQLEAQNRALQKERDGLQGDGVFVEREARRLLGYIRENEKTIPRTSVPVPVKKEERAPYARLPKPPVDQIRGWVGSWQMTLAVILVILVALSVALGFGGRWKSIGPTPPDPIAGGAGPTTTGAPAGKEDKSGKLT